MGSEILHMMLMMFITFFLFSSLQRTSILIAGASLGAAEELSRLHGIQQFYFMEERGENHITIQKVFGEDKDKHETVLILHKFIALRGSEVLADIKKEVPHIELTFDIDANGILHVTAEDKAAKTSQSTTITNDKGQLSQEGIDRMLKEAEELVEEDKKARKKVDAKNKLETYIYNMKNTINDNKLGDKINPENKEKD